MPIPTREDWERRTHVGPPQKNGRSPALVNVDLALANYHLNPTAMQREEIARCLDAWARAKSDWRADPRNGGGAMADLHEELDRLAQIQRQWGFAEWDTNDPALSLEAGLPEATSNTGAILWDAPLECSVGVGRRANFVLLPFAQDRVNYVETDDAVISGFFSGCRMAVYTYQGRRRVGHVSAAGHEHGVFGSRDCVHYFNQMMARPGYRLLGHFQPYRDDVAMVTQFATPDGGAAKVLGVIRGAECHSIFLRPLTGRPRVYEVAAVRRGALQGGPLDETDRPVPPVEHQPFVDADNAENAARFEELPFAGPADA